MKNNTIHTRLAIVFSAVLMLLGKPHVTAQQNGDQRLITLHNGYQYLGYIVEQRPGKDLKLFRPAVNDTITVKLEDIEKVTRIAVKSIAPRAAKAAGTSDTISRPPKFNNKKHVFQLSFLSGVVLNGITDPLGPSLGLGAGYYYSFKNRWFVGGSYQRYVGYSERFYPSNEFKPLVWYTNLNYAVVEGRMRITAKPQNRRMSTLVGIQAGYLMNDFTVFYNYGVYRESYYLEQVHNFVAGASMCFRINPDNNSGWSFEPMITSFRPRTTIRYYDSNWQEVSSPANTKVRITNVSLRCSYYF